jgi:acyl carrier protein
MITKQVVQTDILTLLAQLASDWSHDEEITLNTYLFGELGFQSLDAVILGNSLQENYSRVIPYADLLANLGQQEVADITVGEWADFTYQHLMGASS